MKEDYIIALDTLQKRKALKQKNKEFVQAFLTFIEELGFSTSGLCGKQIENWIDLVSLRQERQD